MARTRLFVFGALLVVLGGACQTDERPLTDEGPRDASVAEVADDAASEDAAVGGNRILLTSDSGDFIGGGRSYSYDDTNAELELQASAGTITVSVTGDERWQAHFVAPSAGELAVGDYEGARRWPFQSASEPGLDWSGEGRGCNELSGSFYIDAIAYEAEQLSQLTLRFEQHCENSSSALHGSIRWSAADLRGAPGPEDPPPTSLWRPASGETPTSGRYVYLTSDPGDFIGAGQTFVYTQANAQLALTTKPGQLTIGVHGDESWNGNFAANSGLDQLVPGYYGDLQRYPFHNPARGGLSWSGEGRGCNKLTGWFVIDAIEYTDGVVTSLDLRFEQHCESRSAALRGEVHWTPEDQRAPTGPQNPPPSDLWEPSAGATPSAGRYVYLQSEAGDYIGGGGSYSYTQADAALDMQAEGGHLSVSVAGDESWWGDFAAPAGATQLEQGYYGDLQRYPFQNPVRGGLSWSGGSRGCGMLSGFFVVDSVTYDAGTLTAIDLRFEQHCDGNSAALHGVIHWTAEDTTAPPGPVQPPPADLWRAPQDAVPAGQRYVYVQSDSGDPIGAGRSYTYTQANAQLSLSAAAEHIGIAVEGDEDWTGDFAGAKGTKQLAPGYYGDLQRYPFQNPVKGGLDWSGQGLGCNNLSGWFVIDDISYSGDTLTSVDLRFEQHCDGDSAALHGQIHWTADDMTAPAGPVNPIPTNLWRAPADVAPQNPRYVYLQSDSGDFVGAGLSHTYTQADAVLTLNATAEHIRISVRGDESWSGDFAGATGTTQLTVGYYADLQRFPFHNPVTGGLSWSGEGRGCNGLSGWFVIDDITYSGDTLTAVDLRFEQHCESAAAALHGQIHWSANDLTTPPGPVNPPPAELWAPAAGATPASGSYVYLQSDAGDFIGGGMTSTESITASAFTTTSGRISIRVGGYQGEFAAMLGLEELQPGYYGGLERYPFHNPSKGGLSWSGNGWGCNTLTGWFVVDAVTYTGGTLSALDLRFEQHCEGGSAALHGKVHLAP